MRMSIAVYLYAPVLRKRLEFWDPQTSPTPVVRREDTPGSWDPSIRPSTFSPDSLRHVPDPLESSRGTTLGVSGARSLWLRLRESRGTVKVWIPRVPGVALTRVVVDYGCKQEGQGTGRDVTFNVSPGPVPEGRSGVVLVHLLSSRGNVRSPLRFEGGPSSGNLHDLDPRQTPGGCPFGRARFRGAVHGRVEPRPPVPLQVHRLLHDPQEHEVAERVFAVPGRAES